MTRAVRVLVVLAVLALTATSSFAHGDHGKLKWPGSWHWRNCQLPDVTDHQVIRLIRCAVDHFPTSLGTAMYVANRESGYEPLADNGGCCKGVYQQHVTYWQGRVDSYNQAMPRRLEVPSSVYDGAANVLVSIRMAHRAGWGPWTTA